jgi:hypothetical protein
MRRLTNFVGALCFFPIFTLVGTTVSFAAPAYELTIIPPASGGIPKVFRIEVASGLVSYISRSDFVAMKEPQNLPAGAYHLYPAVSPNGNKTYWVYRFDAQSGRTWFLTSSNSWQEVLLAN